MVRNFDALIDATRADRDTVTQAVQKALFETPYNKQKQGLINALIKGGAKKDDTPLKKQQIAACLEACRIMNEDEFKKLLQMILPTR